MSIQSCLSVKSESGSLIVLCQCILCASLVSLCQICPTFVPTSFPSSRYPSCVFKPFVLNTQAGLSVCLLLNSWFPSLVFMLHVSLSQVFMFHVSSPRRFVPLCHFCSFSKSLPCSAFLCIWSVSAALGSTLSPRLHQQH